MRELFVYYRVPAGQALAALAEVQRFQAGLVETHVGLHARLLRRAGKIDGAQTWMETYAWPQRACGVTQSLQREIERATARLAPLLDGERHIEVFEAA